MLNPRLSQLCPGDPATDASERRTNRREELVLPLDVYESSEDGLDIYNTHATRGWSQDVSRSGIRFRTHDRLQSRHLTVICRNSQSALDEDVDSINLEIVREHKLPHGLWEYGAVVKRFDDAATYELSDGEFDMLLSELRRASGVVTEQLQGSQFSDSAIVREQDLILSLRSVANSFSASLLRRHLRQKRQRRLGSTIALIVVSAAMMVGLSMAIASMVPEGTWVYLTAASLVLMISAVSRK